MEPTDKLMNKTFNTFTVKDGVKLYFGYVLIQGTASALLPYLRKLEKKVKSMKMDEELKKITEQG